MVDGGTIGLKLNIISIKIISFCDNCIALVSLSNYLSQILCFGLYSIARIEIELIWVHSRALLIQE